MQFNPQHYQIHRESLWRFVALIGLLLAYFVYMSWKYDAVTGALLSVLTWSFFVLCTPVADGGFIIAFPVRLLFGIRMVITQLIAWVAAVVINLVVLTVSPESYQESEITRLLHSILTTPWPDWSILLIAASGTGLSIWFGDEIIDVSTHARCKKYHAHGFKHRILIILGLGVLTMVAYYHLLDDLGVAIPN